MTRTGVYGIALESGKLLVVKQEEGPHSGKFDLPGGGIELGETIEGALRREFSEEVAMTFHSMQLMDNLTTSTKVLKEDGTFHLFHQVGLIYLVNGLLPLQNQTPELQWFWIEVNELKKMATAPLVEQIVQKISMANL